MCVNKKYWKWTDSNMIESVQNKIIKNNYINLSNNKLSLSTQKKDIKKLYKILYI